MRKLIALALFLLSCTAFADALPLDQCKAQVPYGTPAATVTSPTQTVCHHAYILQHDNMAKIPVWVAYTLTPDHSVGCVVRSNAFKPDPDVDSSATPHDYAGTGYDKGHIANDADMSWSVQVEHESFYMTNMTPQLPNLNRGIWKKLETDVREWAKFRGHTLLIYAGPIYNVFSDKKIGADQVDVPTGFYKIIVDTKTNEVMAFIFQNKNYPKSATVDSLEVPVTQVETTVKVQFPLPANFTETKMWKLPATDIVGKEKKTECKIHH